MKQHSDLPPSVNPSEPRDEQLQHGSSKNMTPTREDVRKIAPPIHAPRQSLRPKKQRGK